MQQLRQLLKQREDELAGGIPPAQRSSPLDELKRQQMQPPHLEAWASAAEQQQLRMPMGSSSSDPYAHAYAPSPVSHPPHNPFQQSVTTELRERPGSASAVRLAVLSAKHDPRARPSQQHAAHERSPLAPLDANGGDVDVGGGFNTMGAARKEPWPMLQMLDASADGVNAVDAHGWSALHWAALEGKVEHVAALLDSGAEPARGSTAMMRQAHTHGLDRQPGPLPEDLARAPADGQRSHGPVLKMLLAAAKGCFDARREHKCKGDEAMAADSLHEAREQYTKACRAVPTFMEDSVVFSLTKLRRQVEDAIKENDRKEEDRRQADGSRQAPSSASRGGTGTGTGYSRSTSESPYSVGSDRPPRASSRTPPLVRASQAGAHRRSPPDEQSPESYEHESSSGRPEYGHSSSGKKDNHSSRHSPYSQPQDSRSQGRWSNGSAASLPEMNATPSSARSSRSSSTVASSVSSPERSGAQQDRASSRPPHGSHTICKSSETDTRRSEQLSNAVRCGDTKLTVGDAAGAIAAVETGMRECHEMGVADLLRRSSAQLESEMKAARDYAHRRDSEVYELSVAKKQAEDDASTIRGSMNDEVETLQRSLDDSQRAHEATAREMEAVRRDGEIVREDLARAQQREQQLRDSWQSERSQMRSEVEKLADQTEDLQGQLHEHKETKMTADAMCARSTEELLALQRENATGEQRCRELDRLLRDERDTIRRLEDSGQSFEDEKRTFQDDSDKKLEAAKAVVKQWTSKCKQLKEEHAQVVDDRQRHAAAFEGKLRTTELEVARLKSELEETSNNWKDEVATLRRDRMKERKRADAEATRAAELAQEASRSTSESESISSKLAAAERAARNAEKLEREHAEACKELRALRPELEALQAAQLSDKDTIARLSLERDELLREVDETNAEWQSLQDEMSRLKDQLGQAIHGGEAAFLEANAAKENSQKYEDQLSAQCEKSNAEVSALETELERLRKELSSTSGVVDRANRSVDELQTTLKAERSRVETLDAKAKRQAEAVTAAEEAALRAHEAAEETVRGMMANFR